ncbi:MAG TPA: hypothetical protein VGN47_02810 [Blastococcus sp.]|jgi:hypothetical protein|nr:hypothetical protein [Blastococcus sp.]
MTTAADDFAVEEAFEAYLAGRSVPEVGAGLAAFAGAVRATATEPGRPSAALAELLATGLLVDQPAPSVRTAKKRRRRPMWFFSAIIAKIASAGAVAQAATGAGIVLVGFTGAGAAGALPTPVQHSFATVVDSITPLTAPGGTDTATGTGAADSTAPTTDPADPTIVTTTGSTDGSGAAEPTGTTAPATPTSDAPNAFGKKVSEDAKDGGVDGQQVSSWAHERNDARKHGSDSTAAVTEAPRTDGSHESDASATDGESSARQSSDRQSSDGQSSTGSTGDRTGGERDGGHGHH